MDIWHAIQANDIDFVRQFAESVREGKCNIDIPNKLGETPLVRALKFARAEIVQILLENGADVEWRDADGRTPLVWASLHRQSDITRILLDHGADREACDKCGWTALIMACHTGNIEISRTLIERGADLRTVTSNGATPFSGAIRGGWRIAKYIGECVASNRDLPYSTAPISLFPMPYSETNPFSALMGELLPLYLERAVIDPGFGCDMERDIAGILHAIRSPDASGETLLCGKPEIENLEKALRSLRSIDYTERTRKEDDSKNASYIFDMEL